ncbi:MAG: S8 family serine peptidase [Candidatus Kapabacteria bacterium]|nr:S8 family serine peptidase [Candidatus Kapabacteria bacterium]MDW8012550.1 S8 family peptidase [Bacteroidota bacterium]
MWHRIGVVACLLGGLAVAEAVPVVLKLRATAPSLKEWSAGGRRGTLAFVMQVAGMHVAAPLVPEGLFQALYQRAQQQGGVALFQRLRELERIVVVELPSAVDTAVLLRKLKRHPEVEYVELLPERFLCEVPNDPLVAGQYALNVARVFEAWDLMPADVQPIVVAIVDTGIDMEHPDLADNIFLNPGELGTDAAGRDKRSNGVDDDGNGFVDDWRGWDFAAGSGNQQDNDPRPGNSHGTHVAGIVGAIINNARGIAGIVPKVRLLAVKIGPDEPGAQSVHNAYQGILYAASMGAAVINCSWGGPGRSEVEYEVVRTAVAMGAVIVAAAGNDGRRGPFYPAAYPEVLSVAATDSADNKAPYSNYHETVDIAAPGDEILSLLPGGLYTRMSGTSMAAPVVSGVVALVRQRFPQYSPLQAIARVMMAADDVTQRQPWLSGLLGWGRVNAYRALAEPTLFACFVDSIAITDVDGDGFFDAGDTLQVSVGVRNILDAVDSVVVDIFTPLVPAPEYLRQRIVLSGMATGEYRRLPEPFLLRIAPTVPHNAIMEFRINVRYGRRLIGRGWTATVVRPVYRTLAANNIAVTFNSRGNIAFNDYPENTQGDGFRWRGSPNLLFEGALMVGISAGRLSNVARGALQDQQDRSFVTRQVLRLFQPGPHAALEAEAVFADERRPEDAGVAVRQRIYQFSQAERSDFVLVVYDIVNQTDSAFTTLHVGWYMDWDISPSAMGDRALYDSVSGVGYVVCESCPVPMPLAGAILLSRQPVNFFAIDNDGRGPDNPGVYDGFTREEKWRTMSSGLARLRSNRTDASFVLAGGPIQLGPGDTAQVVLALVAGADVEGLRQAAAAARQAAATLGVDTVPWTPLPSRISAWLFPNPWQPGMPVPTLVLSLPERRYVRIRLVDPLGRFVAELAEGLYQPGTHRFVIPPAELSSGPYFLYTMAGAEGMVVPLVIAR